MEKFKVSFVANNQQLTATGTKHASDTYADIEATFTLGERWTDMDSVSAVWWNDFTRIATVLDSEGKCTVPYEVLTRKGCVRVNLVGSVVEDGELVTRLTSYSAEAVHVNEKIKLTGNEPQTITPSQYEQFVENVKADADRAESAKESAQDASASAQGYAQSASASASSASESATASEQSATASARDAQTVFEIAVEVEVMKNEAELARDEILGMRATATTLEEGSQATANYSNGVLTLGIPRGNTGATGAKGDKGDTGATPNLTIGNVETLEPTESATATITGTAENPVLNLGIPQGDTGEVSLADLSTLLPTDTASGDIASFPDGQSVIPVVSLVADIEPIQSGSGTPSPDNVRPISGWTEVNAHRTGKNLFDTSADPNLITCYSANHVSQSRKGYIVELPSGQYTVSASWVSEVGGVYIYGNVIDGNGDFVRFFYIVAGTSLTTTTLTLTDGQRILVYDGQADTQAITPKFNKVNIQLELGSTATAYEPYLGETYTTSLGRTVYGGTLDVVSGELVVDRLSFTVTGEEADSLYNMPAGSAIPVAGFNLGIPLVNDSGIFDKLNAVSKSYSRFESGDGEVYSSRILFYYGGSSIAEAKAYIASIGGVQAVARLQTPQTIQLTPQQVYALLGENNVWADSGDVSVTYKADVTKWVEKKLS